MVFTVVLLVRAGEKMQVFYGGATSPCHRCYSVLASPTTLLLAAAVTAAAAAAAVAASLPLHAKVPTEA